MSKAESVVARFLEMWEEPGGFARSIRTFFTDRTVYVNEGMTRTTGIEESLQVAQQLEGGGSLRAETLHTSSNGNIVMNERIDTMTGPDGKQMVIPVMGVFEIEGDKIVGWRDYFDTASVFKQMAAAAGDS